jgi:hypothetical protein
MTQLDDDTLLRETFSKILSFVKSKSFIEPDSISDEQAAGVLISKFFMWSPHSVFEVSTNAFEDSNAHEFLKDFEQLWKATEERKLENIEDKAGLQDVEVCF